MKKYVWYVLGIIISSFGNAIMFKMHLGQSTFNAMTYSLGLITGLKIGNISILFNITLIIIQILILRRNFKKIQLLQMVPGIISGLVVNFFLYDFSPIATLSVQSYGKEIFVFICGLIINSFGISLIASADIVAAPSESLCLTLANKTKKSFQFYRTGLDVFFVSVALIVMFLLQTNTNAIREGTVLNLVFMGTLIGFFNSLSKKYIYQ